LGSPGSGHESAGTTRLGRGLLIVFGVIAALIRWGPPSIGPDKTPATVTRVSGATRPVGLAVADLQDAGQLQARFNADQGMPRLVLALAPT
jgi:hypothetical protein